jgi:hypothetical protein
VTGSLLQAIRYCKPRLQVALGARATACLFLWQG